MLLKWRAISGVPLGEGATLRVLVVGRGLHSSTYQLNLSRVCHKKTPYTP